MGTAKRTLAIVAITTALMRCSAPAPPASTPTTQVEPLRIFATTATFPLVSAITTTYLEDTGASFGFDTRYASYATLMNEVGENETGFIVTSHLLDPSDLWVAPIARDALLFVTAPNVTIDGLSVAEIRAIYQGRITRWSEVGGIDQEIIAYSLEPGSDTKSEFNRMIMGSRLIAPDTRILTSSMQMLHRVNTTPNSIGYIAFGERVPQQAVQVLAVEGIIPSQETIASDLYPLRSTIFIVGREEPTVLYRDFVSWIQSPLGQEAVSLHYVPLLAPQFEVPRNN